MASAPAAVEAIPPPAPAAVAGRAGLLANKVRGEGGTAGRGEAGTRIAPNLDADPGSADPFVMGMWALCRPWVAAALKRDSR